MASSIRQAAKFADDGGGGASGATQAATFNSPVLAGSAIVAVWTSDNATPPTVTVDDNVNAGNYGAAVESVVEATDHQLLGAHVKGNSAAGTPTVTIHFSPNETSKGICILEITGVSSSPVDPNGHKSNQQSTPTTGTGAVTSGVPAGPLSQSNNLVLGFSMDVHGATGPSADTGAGFADGGIGWFGGLMRVESKNISNGTAIATTFTAAINENHQTIVITLMDSLPAVGFAYPTYPRGFRMAGPTVLRTPVHTPLPNDQAPVTDTNFITPTYPASFRLRLVGPTALRTGVQHPPLPLDQAPPTNTRFIFPTYPAVSHPRIIGPPVLREGVVFPWLPNDQAPVTDTNFVLPTYAAKAGRWMVGPVALRRVPRLPADAAISSGGDVTVALTGVQATGQVGTMTAAIDTTLTGVAGTGAAGTVTPAIDTTLTGTAGTGAVGTVSPATAVGLTGNQASGAVGTVSPATATSLTGVQGTGSPGSVSPATAVALTGNQAAGAAGNVTPGSAAALTGVQGTGAAGSVSPTTAVGLGGVQGTGQVGTPLPSIAVGVTGVVAIGQVGTPIPATAAALTGVQATGQVGTVSPAIAVALTGVEGIGQVGSVIVLANLPGTDIPAAATRADLAPTRTRAVITSGQTMADLRFTRGTRA